MNENPELHYRWCIEKAGGDKRVALLMMESAAMAVEGDSPHNFLAWNVWLTGMKMRPIAA